MGAQRRNAGGLVLAVLPSWALPPVPRGSHFGLELQMHLRADPPIYNLFQFFFSELRVCMSKSLFMSTWCLMGLPISAPHCLGCLLPGSLLLTRLACAGQAPPRPGLPEPHMCSHCLPSSFTSPSPLPVYTESHQPKFQSQFQICPPLSPLCGCTPPLSGLYHSPARVFLCSPSFCPFPKSQSCVYGL